VNFGTVYLEGCSIIRFLPLIRLNRYSRPIVRDANIVLAKSLPYFAARNLATLTTPCLGEDNFYAFSAIEMKVIVVGPGLDIVQFSGARMVT